MKILFEENKTENSVRIYQTNGISKTRIASFDLSKKKIVLAQVYRKDLEKRNISLKEVSGVLLSEYNNWLYTTSPLRNLSKDQMAKLLRDLKSINVLSVCFQDYITSLSILDSLDLFGEVTKDLHELKDNILSFTAKVSAITGIEQSINIGDIADNVSELIESKI